MRNDPEVAESLRCREEERECILKTFYDLLSTPPSWKVSTYAWRDQTGSIQFSSGLVKRPEGTLVGRSEGHLLLTKLFCVSQRPGALRVEDVLTPEQQATARRAAAEIDIRNEHEMREMRKRALQDLLRKEQNT